MAKKTHESKKFDPEFDPQPFERPSETVKGEDATPVDSPDASTLDVPALPETLTAKELKVSGEKEAPKSALQLAADKYARLVFAHVAKTKELEAAKMAVERLEKEVELSEIEVENARNTLLKTSSESSSPVTPGA